MSATTTIKERPISFTGPMVLAIREGRKTQTRRVVKFPCEGCWDRGQLEDSWFDQANPVGSYPTFIRCPYGVPGDRLWVRETWAYHKRVPISAIGGSVAKRNLLYRADFPDPHSRHHAACAGLCEHWRASIHMPRWASRILLEIVSVRVERVQDMNPWDVLAEGLQVQLYAGIHFNIDHELWPEGERLLLGEFAKTWDSINAPRGYGWALNPWVWAITFKRLDPSGKAAERK